jgi:hypothetical protein
MKLRPAQAILCELNEGHTLEDLAQAFHDAIEAVKEHGKPASINLSITIGTLGENQHHLIEAPVIMQAEVITKLPKAKPAATIYFIDADGNPVRNQTRQESLNLSVAIQSSEGSK